MRAEFGGSCYILRFLWVSKQKDRPKAAFPRTMNPNVHMRFPNFPLRAHRSGIGYSEMDYFPLSITATTISYVLYFFLSREKPPTGGE
jgi:hypothetical protein